MARPAPGPHHAAVGPLAEQQRHRVHQHGLSRTGLTGEHVEAGAELERDVGDGGEVADPELGDHRIDLPLGEISPVQLLPHPGEVAFGARADQQTAALGARRTYTRSPRASMAPTWPS